VTKPNDDTVPFEGRVKFDGVTIVFDGKFKAMEDSTEGSEESESKDKVVDKEEALTELQATMKKQLEALKITIVEVAPIELLDKMENQVEALKATTKKATPTKLLYTIIKQLEALKATIQNEASVKLVDSMEKQLEALKALSEKKAPVKTNKWLCLTEDKDGKADKRDEAEKMDEAEETDEPPKPDDVMKEIESLVGLEEFKSHCRELSTKVETARREKTKLKTQDFNIAFQGNSGTGR
jgi:hypothetical protein